MSLRTFATTASLFIAVALLCAPCEAQTYCLTPTAVPQPPPPPSPPPACQPRECDKCTKSPCYVATGIYARDDVDLTIPTAGTFSLIASRLYDSSRLTDGPLGTGWFLSLTAHLYYATYLVTAPNTYSHEADIVMPDGVLYRFTIGSAGTFSAPFGRFDTLVRNADGTYALTLQNSRTVYRFSADGSITSLTDEYGNLINWTYDGAGHVLRVADGAGSGRYIDVTWGADGRIATLTDNSGRQVKYYYDPTNGTLSGVADPIVSGNGSLRSATYSYAQSRFGTLLTRIADRWNRVVSALEWYPEGKLKSYTDGFYDASNPAASSGEKYTYAYYPSTAGGYTTKSNSLGLVSYPYDSIGLVNDSGQSYANGLPTHGGFRNLSSYEYDATGRITKVTSPSPEPSGSATVVWWYTYDGTWPDKIASIIPKDAAGNLKTNWAGWKYDYHGTSDAAPGSLAAVWRVRSDTTTKDSVASYVYDSHGHLLQSYDDDAFVTGYLYNAYGDLVSVTSPGGYTTQFTYDALGRVLSTTDPAGHTTTMTYDALDRLLTITRPRPNTAATYDTVTTFSYDNYDSATGLVFTNTTDPNGRVTKQGYDALGHARQSVDASGNVTTFVYQYDRLKTIRDANGNETSYGYDTNRELNRTTFPDGTFESYFISNGVLSQRIDRRGQAANYAYDDLGRVASITYQGLYGNTGAVIGQTYSYDGQKLISVSDSEPGGVAGHAYTYDGSWRIATDASATGTQRFTYINYASGGPRLGSYTIEPPPNTTGTTQTVTYNYDGSGRIAGQTWSWVPNAPFSFVYTPTGQYSRITFPNGQQRRFTYDNQDRLTNITNTDPGGYTIASFDYGYDYDWPTSTYSMRGQRTSVSVTAPGTPNLMGGLTKYSYDASYQLVRAEYPNGSSDTWTYDAIGNRLSKAFPAPGYALPYTYYTNAAGGNTQRLRNDSWYDFTYDANGNLTSAFTQYGSNPYTWDYANRLTSYGGKSYAYDVFGRTSTTATGSTTKYISMNSHTVGERNTATGLSTDYIFGLGIDEPLAKRAANGSITYFGVDGLGSVVLSTDTTGAVLSSTNYSPWGETTYNPPELFGYTGRETGGPSWYYRARHYDAAHGRFLSEDRSADMPGYGYVGNDPITYGDPFGLERWNRPYPLPPPNPLTNPPTSDCVKSLRRLLALYRRTDAASGSDSLKHCSMGCEISKVCGDWANLAAAFAKEFKDAFTPRRQSELRDINNTFKGGTCAKDPSGCVCCCKTLEAAGRLE